MMTECVSCGLLIDRGNLCVSCWAKGSTCPPCPRCAALEAEVARLTGLIEKAWHAGYQEGFSECSGLEHGLEEVGADEGYKDFQQRSGLAPAAKVEHFCGLQGFNPMKGDTCPACEGLAQPKEDK
jgi:hypothetical protein